MLCSTIADLSNLTSFSILKTELSYIHLTIILLPKTSKVIGAKFLAAHKKSEKRRSIIMIHTHSFAFLRKTWANGFSCLRIWWVEMCGYVCGLELHIRGWQCEIMTHDHNGVNHFSKRMEFLIGIKTPFCSFGSLSLLPYLYSSWIIWRWKWVWIFWKVGKLSGLSLVKQLKESNKRKHLSHTKYRISTFYFSLSESLQKVYSFL